MANTLVGKIAAASIKVGALATDKTNTQQNYNYISADKVLERGGAALAAQGVVVIPTIKVEETIRHEGTNQYGKTQIRYDSIVEFDMRVTDGTDTLEAHWVGRGSDYAVPDKALYKAITSGHKYFLMKLLNIGVGNEDGEHETQPDAQPQTPQKPVERTNGRAASNHTAQPTKTQQRASTQPTAHIDDAEEVNPDGPDNLFETLTPTDAELVDIGTWQTPEDAQEWAVSIGGCANVHEARNSFKNLVTEQFDGRLTKANIGPVYVAWHRKQQAKAAERKQAA